MATTVWEVEAMESEIINDLTSTGYHIEDVIDALRDVIVRVQWTVDSSCLIYSRSSNKWCEGRITIATVDQDTNEEWLTIQYGKKKKRMQRFCAYLRPISFGDSYVFDGTIVAEITRKLRSASEENPERFNIAYDDEEEWYNFNEHHSGNKNNEYNDYKDYSQYIGFNQLQDNELKDDNYYDQYHPMNAYNDHYHKEENEEPLPLIPRLEIVGLENDTATIMLSNNAERIATEYSVLCVHYRNGGVSGFTEKSMEWKIVDVILPSNCHTISDLTPNTTYSVYGQFKKDELWSDDTEVSELSKVITFTTRGPAESEIASLVFVYWLRQMSRNMDPGFLLEVMLRYYCSPKFQWDNNDFGNGLTVSTNGLVFEKGSASGRATVFSKNQLSASNVDVVNWEITVKPGEHQTYFLMGYVVDNSMFNWDEELGEWHHNGRMNNFIGDSQDREELALYIADGTNPMMYSKGEMRLVDSQCKVDMQEGDRLRLQFNFRKTTCNAFLNDYPLGILTKELPPKVYPAASVFYGGTFETTLFEVM